MSETADSGWQWRDVSAPEAIAWCSHRSVAGASRSVPDVGNVQLFSDGGALKCRFTENGFAFSVSDPPGEGWHLTITNQNTGFVLTTP